MEPSWENGKYWVALSNGSRQMLEMFVHNVETIREWTEHGWLLGQIGIRIVQLLLVFVVLQQHRHVWLQEPSPPINPLYLKCEMNLSFKSYRISSEQKIGP